MAGLYLLASTMKPICPFVASPIAMPQKPYPTELIEHFTLWDGARVNIRPIRPKDLEIERAFVRGLSSESRYFRFLHSLRELDERTLIRFTDIDYDAQMALIAVVCENGLEVEIGVARYVVGKSARDCEFAVAVADCWQGKSIARRLMRILIRAAHDRGLKTMEGFVHHGNRSMFALATALGFHVESIPGDASIRRVVRDLRAVPGIAVGINHVRD